MEDQKHIKKLKSKNLNKTDDNFTEGDYLDETMKIN